MGRYSSDLMLMTMGTAGMLKRLASLSLLFLIGDSYERRDLRSFLWEEALLPAGSGKSSDH